MAKRKSMGTAVGGEASTHKGIFDTPYLGGSDSGSFGAEEGTTNLDIIPYEITEEDHPMVRAGKREVGDLWYQRTFFIHRGIGPQEETVICPYQSFGKPCPICEEMKRLFNTKEAEDKTQAKAIMPKERELFRAVNLDDDPDEILLWDVSYHLFGKQLRKEIKRGDSKHDCFADLEGGLTVQISFEESKSEQGSFVEADRIDFVEREKDYEEAILSEGPDLNGMIECPEYDHLNSLMLGQAAPAKEKDEEPEQKPKASTSKKTSKKSSKKGEGEDLFKKGVDVSVTDDGTVYNGVIVSVDGDEIAIDFDGNEETWNRSDVTLKTDPLPDEPKVEEKPKDEYQVGGGCSVEEDGETYTGAIAAVEGDQITVAFDSEDIEDEVHHRDNVTLIPGPGGDGTGEPEGNEGEWGDWD